RKRKRVSGADAEQQAGERLAECERARYADEDANRGELQALSKDAAENIAPLRTKGDAHADLLRPLRDGKGKNCVDSDRGEKQRERGEASEERGLEFARREIVFEHRL